MLSQLGCSRQAEKASSTSGSIFAYGGRRPPDPFGPNLKRAGLIDRAGEDRRALDLLVPLVDLMSRGLRAEMGLEW